MRLPIYDIKPLKLTEPKDTTIYLRKEDVEVLYEIGLGFQSLEDVLMSVIYTYRPFEFTDQEIAYLNTFKVNYRRLKSD